MTRAPFVGRTTVQAAAFLLGLVAAAPVSYAGRDMIRLALDGEYQPSPWTFENTYTDRAMGKLGYGLKNILLGWLDLFLEPAEAVSEQRPFWPGVGIGVRDAFQNTFGGLIHALTFPVTRVDVTLPEDGVHFKDPASQPRIKGPGP